MNPIKKVALYSALIGSLAFGGNALAQEGGLEGKLGGNQQKQEQVVQSQYNFADVYKNVRTLNEQLEASKKDNQHVFGDKAVSFKLFDVVKQMNERYGLGLDNYSLGIRTEGNDIVIHYWGGKKAPFNDYEATIRITAGDVATRTIKDLATGQSTSQTYKPVK